MGWLLDEIGFKRLTNEEQKYLENVAADTVFNRVIERVADKFDHDQTGVIRHLFEEGSETEIEEFLRSHGLNLEALIGEELERYRGEIIGAKEMLINENG